jgi:hypothetical protein
MLESVLNRRISNRRISNFEVLVPRRSYFCGSKFIIRHSAVCFQLPFPANSHRLFNPVPPEARLACDSCANGNAVIAVSVKTSPTFIFETPRTLFQGTYVSSANSPGSRDFGTWDISPDGKQFLMIKEPTSAESASRGARKINIVLNWIEELKQKMPVK